MGAGGHRVARSAPGAGSFTEEATGPSAGETPRDPSIGRAARRSSARRHRRATATTTAASTAAASASRTFREVIIRNTPGRVSRIVMKYDAY